MYLNVFIDSQSIEKIVNSSKKYVWEYFRSIEIFLRKQNILKYYFSFVGKILMTSINSYRIENAFLNVELYKCYITIYEYEIRLWTGMYYTYWDSLGLETYHQ